MYPGCSKVLKRHLTETEINELKKELTLPNFEYLERKRLGKYIPAELREFDLFYEEHDSFFIIPRNTLKNLGLNVPSKTQLVLGDFADINFYGSLREMQTNFLSKIDFAVNDVIFNVPCAHGKTVMALWYASQIKRKTLIIVPTNVLAQQWYEKIVEFTKITPLILDNSEKCANSIYLYSIYIVSIDLSTVLNNYIYNILIQSVGLAILDEAHRLGAETYYPVITHLPAKRRLCLTATFRRNDLRHEMLRLNFGGAFHKMPYSLEKASYYGYKTNNTFYVILDLSKIKKLERLKLFLESHGIKYAQTENYLGVAQINSQKLNFSDVNAADKLYISKCAENLQFSSLDSFIAELNEQKELFKSVIDICLSKGRTILVLARRKELLYEFYNYYKENYYCEIVVSEMYKKIDWDKLRKEVRIVFGIEQLAKEGLDIDRLDTLLPYHPIKDIEQAIGRITRFYPDKKVPLVFVPTDLHHAYRSIFTKSLFYAKDNAIYEDEIPYTEIEEICQQKNQVVQKV